MYICNHSGARSWFPCLDTLSERATYEMEYTVSSDLVVVSSGDLIEQVFSEDMSQKTFYYSLGIPTTAQMIGLCVGPFEIVTDPVRPASITNFCLPGREQDLAHSTSFITKVV